MRPGTSSNAVAVPAARSAARPWHLLAVVVLLLLLWLLRAPLMLMFGAVLVAASLHAMSDPLAAHSSLSSRMSLGTVLVLALLILGAITWLMGDQLSGQLQDLRKELPRARTALAQWLSASTLGARLLDLIDELQTAPVPWTGIANVATDTVRVASAVVLVVLMGIYMAFDVGMYKQGLVRLFPMRLRPSIGDALDATGEALSRWLLGQAITMLVVGVLVAAGLAILGMPLPLALGLIAGLLEFVPFFGPFASGGLAVLVAFVQGPQAALEVAVMFIGIQQVEGNLIVPLVQRWAVKLPPVLGIASVLVFGTLFGVAGIVFGTPLAVVAMILVRKLYVERTLEGGSA